MTAAPLTGIQPSPLRQSGAPKTLQNLNLAEGFGKFVIGDPEFQRLAHAAESDSLTKTITKRFLPGTNRPLWPVYFETVDFAKTEIAWLPQDLYGNMRKAPPPSEAFLLASRILGDRYSALIELLRRAEVLAIGYVPGASAANPIDAGFWKNPAYSINVKTGDFFATKPNELLWRNVTLKLPADVVGLGNGNKPAKGTAGRPPEYNWGEAVDRVMLRMGRQGLPEMQKDLIGWFADEFAKMPGDIPDESTIRDFLCKSLPKTRAAIKDSRRSKTGN